MAWKLWSEMNSDQAENWNRRFLAASHAEFCAIADEIKFLPRMKARLAVLALLFSLSASAQPTNAPETAAQAVVTFRFQWNEGTPWQSYSIQVQADGKTHFEGTPNPSQGGDTGPVQQDFVMSEANRQRIFDAAGRLNYFRSDLDSHVRHIAQTGAKTLAYKSAEIQGSSTYNYSQDSDVQQLTQLFLGLAATIDCGRKLAWSYRFDKLGLDQLLHELEELQANHQAEELNAIAPILRKLADDPNLMHISRQRAQRLLKTTGTPDAATHSAAPP